MAQTLERKEVVMSPEPLYRMAMGFGISKAFLAAHNLGIFECLKKSPKTASEVAREQGLSEAAAESLLNACAALELCRKEGDAFTNSPLTDRYLLREHPAYLGRFFDHFNIHMYPAWFYLEEAVRSGRAQIDRVVGEKEDHFFQAIDRKPSDLETFMETMEEHSLLEGEALAKAFDFSPYKTMLDVAGGTGAMTAMILKSWPHLTSILFDRPPVCPIAEQNIRKHSQADRVRIVPGDFFKEALPQGADLVLLSAILHNWSPEIAKAILRRCADALPPGGTLILSEQVLSESKTGPLPAVLASLNMLLIMDGGREYSRSEYAAFLSETGFELVEVRPTGGLRQLLIARRC